MRKLSLRERRPDAQRMTDPETGEAYYLAGVWDSYGRILWASEPTSYPTRRAAMDAAIERAAAIIAEGR